MLKVSQLEVASRPFFTRAETAAKLFLFDAGQLKKARRKRDSATRTLLEQLRPKPACRLQGFVFEAEADEFLHAQIRLRLRDDTTLPPELRELALTIAVEDGFTMETE